MDQNQDTKVEVEETKEEERSPDVAGFLSAFPGSPSEGQIEKWKEQFGEVLCSAFSDTELHIWRPLSRQEYLQIQSEIIRAGQAGAQVSEAEIELRTVTTCLLWSSEPGRRALDTKGGSVSTLNEQIMLGSNFMPAPMAASMVIKL